MIARRVLLKIKLRSETIKGSSLIRAINRNCFIFSQYWRFFLTTTCVVNEIWSIINSLLSWNNEIRLSGRATRDNGHTERQFLWITRSNKMKTWLTFGQLTVLVGSCFIGCLWAFMNAFEDVKEFFVAEWNWLDYFKVVIFVWSSTNCNRQN